MSQKVSLYVPSCVSPDDEVEDRDTDAGKARERGGGVELQEVGYTQVWVLVDEDAVVRADLLLGTQA
jgi:hypothetical protein